MEYAKDITNRLKRIEGQIRGVLKMMEEGKDCTSVVHQLSAIRSAVDKVTVHVIGEDMGNCLLESIQKEENLKESEKIINNALQLILKTR